MELTRRLALAGRAAQEHASGRRDAQRRPQSADEILEKVLTLPIFTWSYTREPISVERCGPMAQEFFQIFGFGADDTRLPTESALGVCLISIKVLARRLSAAESELEQLRRTSGEHQPADHD